MIDRKRNKITGGHETQSDSPKESKTVTVYDNFKQGDLLFGLSAQRNEVDTAIQKKGFHHHFPNKLNNPVVDIVVDSIESKENISGLDKEQKQHLTFLQKHKEYLVKQPGKPIETIKDDPVVSGAYRRACKLLLINREAGRTANAHVMTKGINWKRVCAKEDKGVTNSEIRAAYRDFKKNGKNPHIFFYDDKHKQMNELPWQMQQFKSHWKRYDKLRQDKKDKAVKIPAAKPIRKL